MEGETRNSRYWGRPRKRRRSDTGTYPTMMIGSPLWLSVVMQLLATTALWFPASDFYYYNGFVSGLVARRTPMRGRSTDHHQYYPRSTQLHFSRFESKHAHCVPGQQKRMILGAGPSGTTSATTDVNDPVEASIDSDATLHDTTTSTTSSQATISTAEETPEFLDLESLGWELHFAAQLEGDENNRHGDGSSTKHTDDDTQQQEQEQDRSLIPVRITEVRSKSIHVLGPGGIDQLISLSKGQKIINDNPEKVVVAGDWILAEELIFNGDDVDNNSSDDEMLQLQKDEPTLRIHKILNRKSSIQRKAPGRKTRKKQLIAANLDTVFVVSSCNQDFNVARLERYIAMVLETEHVAPVIVLTKKDLLEFDDGSGGGDDDLDDDDDFDDSELDLEFEDNEDDDELLEEDDELDDADASSWLLDYYRSEAGSIAGGSIPVVCLDARNGQEASELLAPWLGEGQTVAFVGSSGVGKSTLVNSLCGSERAATGAIHTDSGQGRHTTTRRQLHLLERPDGTCSSILDTPGLRELQLVDTAQGLGLVFGDLVELSRHCRFNDCTHCGEPGCAIEAALERGEIDPDRVARWEKLRAEDAANTRDVEEGRRERERKKQRRRARAKRKQDTL